MTYRRSHSPPNDRDRDSRRSPSPPHHTTRRHPLNCNCADCQDRFRYFPRGRVLHPQPTRPRPPSVDAGEAYEAEINRDYPSALAPGSGSRRRSRSASPPPRHHPRSRSPLDWPRTSGGDRSGPSRVTRELPRANDHSIEVERGRSHYRPGPPPDFIHGRRVLRLTQEPRGT